MLNINSKKLNTTYLIETSNFDEVIKEIKKIAIDLGFDEKLVNNDTHLDLKIIKCERFKDEADVEKTDDINSDTNKKDKNDKKLRYISISEIREEVVNDSILSPSLASKKIYIIYNFSNVSISIQNTLLKTIEEPEDNVHFFILTDNISKVINTVKSRSVIIFDNNDYNLKNIYNTSLIDLEKSLNTFSNIKNVSNSEITEFSSDFIDNKYDIKLFIKFIRYFIRDIYVYRYTFDKDLLNLDIDFKYIEKFKESLNNQKLGLILDEINKLSKEINTNIDKNLSLTMFMINIKNILVR